MCRLQMSILAVPMIKTEQDNQQVSGACINPESNREKRLTLSHDHQISPRDLNSDRVNGKNLILPLRSNIYCLFFLLYPLING